MVRSTTLGLSDGSGEAMSAVWDKLFGGQPPANDRGPLRPDGTEGDHETAEKAAPSAERRSDPAPRSQQVSRTFDSIGRRNEALRAHLDAVEMSFRNIEAIRSQFHETLIPIDQTLAEIEKTKVAHSEAERKAEALSLTHDRLKSDHAGLTLERNALVLKAEELAGRVGDLERGVKAAETASGEARALLAERTAKLERIERELEDNRRRLQAVTEQLPALRAEFVAKEKRLQEVDQQRASLHDQAELAAQENRSLRGRVDELVADVSKLNRQLLELEGRREDAGRRITELEDALSHETAAHAKLKSAQLDAEQQHRLNTAKLKEDLSATTSRSDAAEKLLAEARLTLRDREAAIRGFERKALEHSLAAKSKDAMLADLEKDLLAVRTTHSEVDSARSAAVEHATQLAKTLEDREVALQRAEQRIEQLEAKVAELNKTVLGERVAAEERVARLTEQLEAESAGRAFAEGALQTARQERGARRGEAEAAAATPAPAAPAKDASSEPAEKPRDKIARLRS